MARRGHEFTPEEIERSLTALALCGGNSSRALELIKQDPTFKRHPSDRVLRLWRSKHANRYREIHEERSPQIEAAAVHNYREILVRSTETHLKAVERTYDGINDLDAKDASAAAKNIAIAGGIAAEKLFLMTDRPTIRLDKPDPEHLLNSIARVFNIAIPSTAEDITDAQPVDESPVGIAQILEGNPRHA